MSLLSQVQCANIDIDTARETIAKAIEKRDNAKQAKHDIAQDAIKEQLASFLTEMSDNWNFDSYVDGSFSSDFTKYIKRNYGTYGWFSRSKTSYLSPEHEKAVTDFLEAKKEMNRVFVEALRTESGAENFIKCASIKNIKKYTE